MDKDLSVCVIGAGFSGVGTAIKLRKELGLTNFVIYERHADVGGTWFANRYPGCACDVPSHFYSFSFEPNPNWSSYFSPYDEIQRYIKKLCEKHDLYSKLRFHHEVKELIWDEANRNWRVLFVDHNKGNTVEERRFDVVVNGSGILRNPRIPQEFLSYKGKMVHSAQWNDSFNPGANDTVGIVGTGVTTLQLVQTLPSQVKELHVYQRSPPWVLPVQQFKWSAMWQFLFAWIPLVLWIYRAYTYYVFECLAWAFRPGHKTANDVVAFANMTRMTAIPDSKAELRELMKPKYDLGCKRIGFAHSFYENLSKPNVQLHTSPIETVESDALVTKDGKKQKFDLLILATGYTVQEYFGPIKITGTNGVDVLKLWKETSPNSYLGIVSSNMPNFFNMLGPYTILGHNSVLFMIECQIDFTMRVLRQMMKKKKKTVTIKLKEEAKQLSDLKKDLKKRSWSTGGCNAWYQNDKGEVTTIWPYTCTYYWWKCRFLNWNHFDFE